jgi:hypothetical protein
MSVSGPEILTRNVRVGMERETLREKDPNFPSTLTDISGYPPNPSHPQPLHAAALEYGNRGYQIFPLSERHKTPRIGQNWKKVAATLQNDLNKIDAIWEAEPDLNIGLPTGYQFDVLDLDGQTGLDSFRNLLPTTGYRHEGPIVKTPRGTHLYFQPTGWTVWSTGREVGIDWRGRGGYVVAPPSINTEGDKYRWVNPLTDTIPQMPEWLHERLRILSSQPRHPQMPKTAEERDRPDICRVAVALGIHTRHGTRFCKARCPFHDNQHEPSLILWRDNNRYYCSSGSCHAMGWSDQLIARTQ